MASRIMAAIDALVIRDELHRIANEATTPSYREDELKMLSRLAEIVAQLLNGEYDG
jgi:hypothetical protein